MKKILIFGSGVHSKIVFSEIIKLKNYSIIGFVDDFSKKNKIVETYKNKKYKVIGGINNTKIIANKNTVGIIGVGTNFIRKKIFDKVNKIYKNFIWESIISKDSIISSNVKIGKGSLIVSNSVINTGSKIGDHCLINTSSSIDHDNYFANFASTGPGVTTGGNVTVGELSCLGIGSTIKHQIKIGKNTIIGGQSFVYKNCKSYSIYSGIPAKKIRNRTVNEKYL